MSPQQIPNVEPVDSPSVNLYKSGEEGIKSTLGRILLYHPKFYTIINSPSLIQRDLQLFITVMLTKNREITTLLENTSHWLWININYWKPKHHCGLATRMGAYWDQVISEVLAYIHVTVNSVDTWIHPVVISPNSECLLGIDILSNWQNSYIGSLTWGVKFMMIGKTK